MPCNILITCGGRWVGLVQQLKLAMRSVPQFRDGRLLVADQSELTPAGHFADQACVVPPATRADYADALLDLCRREQVRVVLPHTDIDLEPLAAHQAEFARAHITLVCPAREIVELCNDKLKFSAFARQERLCQPQTYSIDSLTPDRLPVFAKRRHSFGGVGSTVCRTTEVAAQALQDHPDMLFQEFIDADEVSIDAYVNSARRMIVRVPRMRDKVIGGEAVRSHTIRDPAVVELADRTIAALARHGFCGPLNVQVFHQSPPKLIEVNPRLGSACLLANVATGGRFFTAILRDAIGIVPEGDPNDYQDNLHLYRYSGALFYDGVAHVFPHTGSD